MENWSNIELIFAKNLHITPSEIDKLEFYRIEMLIRAYEKNIEEERKQQKQQEGVYEKQYSSHVPKQPQVDYGGFKVPKMDIPKINMPNFK